MNKEITECLACGGRDLVNFINFGEVPLANTYPEKEEELPVFPLDVNYCRDCSHSQLSVAVDPDLLFKDYLYVSGTTDTLKRHFTSLAEDALGRVKRSRVLDIGCNDGSLMKAFQDAGAEDVQGVDPAENLSSARKQMVGYESFTRYWNKETAQVVGKYDIITGLNVFAHNGDPLGFLEACKEALAPEGFVIIEFPYGKQTFLEAQDGQIYHEHINYFLVSSFARLTERAGFGIVEILETKVHGGSIRFFLQYGVEHSKKVTVYKENEMREGLRKEETYLNFSKQVQQNYRDLMLCVATQASLGYKVIGYGAAAKTSTLLNAIKMYLPVLKAHPNALPYIVDDNPLKVNRLVPGVNIPIRGTEELTKEEGPICHLIFSWNFRQEIIGRIRKLRPEAKDSVLTHVPKLLLEDL